MMAFLKWPVEAILRYFNTVVRSQVSVRVLYIGLAATTKIPFNARSALMTPWSHLEKLGIHLQLRIYTLLSFSRLRVCPYARLSVSHCEISPPELEGPERDPHFFPHTTVGSGEYVIYPASQFSPDSGCCVTPGENPQSPKNSRREAIQIASVGKNIPMTEFFRRLSRGWITRGRSVSMLVSWRNHSWLGQNGAVNWIRADGWNLFPQYPWYEAEW